MENTVLLAHLSARQSGKSSPYNTLIEKVSTDAYAEALSNDMGELAESICGQQLKVP